MNTMKKKLRVTVEIEFSETGMEDFKDAVLAEYDDKLRTVKDVEDHLAHYATEGIQGHFEVMGIVPVDGHATRRASI